MAKNTTNAKQVDPVDEKSLEEMIDDRPDTPATNPRDKSGVPVETYKGERKISHQADPGDLDEETLDPNAPFNKTYGIGEPAKR